MSAKKPFLFVEIPSESQLREVLNGVECIASNALLKDKVMENLHNYTRGGLSPERFAMEIRSSIAAAITDPKHAVALQTALSEALPPLFSFAQSQLAGVEAVNVESARDVIKKAILSRPIHT